MKTIVLIFGLFAALLAGFCSGYEYGKSLSRTQTPGYSIIEAGKAVTSFGDTVEARDFRGLYRK
jgi:hypothetical protein